MCVCVWRPLLLAFPQPLDVLRDARGTRASLRLVFTFQPLTAAAALPASYAKKCVCVCASDRHRYRWSAISWGISLAAPASACFWGVRPTEMRVRLTITVAITFTITFTVTFTVTIITVVIHVINIPFSLVVVVVLLFISILIVIISIWSQPPFALHACSTHFLIRNRLNGYLA